VALARRQTTIVHHIMLCRVVCNESFALVKGKRMGKRAG